MIEQISDFMESCGAESVNLSIHNKGNGQVCVIVNTLFGTLSKEIDKSVQMALSHPLVMSGYKGEIDVELPKTFDRYEENIGKHSDVLRTNVDKAGVDGGTVKKDENKGSETSKTDDGEVVESETAEQAGEQDADSADLQEMDSL